MGKGLERSCAAGAGDRVRRGTSRPGLERLEARFAGHAFDPHRHDTYAVGFTTRGVQEFRYRGAMRRSTPGQVFVLHPDEVHDGHAGTRSGFHYRILYVDPRLIREALPRSCRALPYVDRVVSDDARLAGAIVPALGDLDEPLEDLRFDEMLAAIAQALAAAETPRTGGRPAACHRRAVKTARELLDASAPDGVSSRELERVTGLSRYALARHFRACLGTTPHRYLVMRRLDRARALIRSGDSLATAAAASGFADQSHMTRHFRQAWGVTPGRWVALTGGPSRETEPLCGAGPRRNRRTAPSRSAPRGHRKRGIQHEDH